MDAKVEHLHCKCYSLGVNTPSTSRNVYFANGQTDRILVPYDMRILGMCQLSFFNLGGFIHDSKEIVH
jgi:hypothetical protein